MFSESAVAECGYENDSGPTAADNAYPGHLCYWRLPSPSERAVGGRFFSVLLTTVQLSKPNLCSEVNPGIYYGDIGINEE